MITRCVVDQYRVSFYLKRLLIYLCQVYFLCKHLKKADFELAESKMSLTEWGNVSLWEYIFGKTPWQ